MTQRINRRDFIGKSAAGLVSAGLGVPFLSRKASSQDEPPKIITRTLGRTELKVPIVSFGVMNSDSPNLIRRAIEMGVKHLDTAHGYLRGNSEVSIGKTLQEDKTRDHVYISTKMRFGRDQQKGVFLREDGREPGATQENFDKQLGISLRRLRTDYVDILYLHSCYTPQMVTYEPLMSALMKAKKAGKARFLGISTHTNEPACIRAAVDSSLYDVVLTAYNVMKDNKEEIRQAVKYAAGKNIGIVAMKTHGGNRLNRDPDARVDHEAAYKWVLNDTNVTTTIPGMTTFEQLDFNFRAMSDIALSASEERELLGSAQMQHGAYCQNCRLCTSTCPQGVEIPVLMRAYMYAEVYGNLIQAGTTLDELPEDRSLRACGDCGRCAAVCANGIKIESRLRRLISQGLA